MTKEEEEAKAAADKAAADAAAKAAAAGAGGPTPEERKAADEKRAADERAYLDKAKAAASQLDALDRKIKEAQDQLAADAKKGDDTAQLKAEIADLRRQQVDTDKILRANEQEKLELKKQRDESKLQTDLRKELTGKLLDDDTTTFAIEHLILRGKARVDADNKVSVVDEKGNWGSLSSEALLRHLPDALKPAKGGAGGGQRGPSGEAVVGDAWQRGKMSQKEFEVLVAKGEIPTGDGIIIS